MNIILTRTKDEHLNVWWEPFATSTPLKPKSSNAKFVNVPQKQVIHSDSPDFVDKFQRSCRTANVLQKKSAESKHLVFKRIRRKKSSTYFDLTSSSDEGSSDGNKKRPIIKLKSGKKFKSILVNKNLSNEKIEKISANKEGNNCKKLENINIKDCETNAVFNVEDLRSKSVQSHSNKSRTLNDTLKLGSDFKDNSLSSNEGSKIFDETTKARNKTKDITVNKENSINNSKNDSVKHLTLSNNAEKKNILKETFITKPNFTKNIHKNNGHDSEIIQNRTSECNKSCKSQKRKSKDNKSSSNIVKNTSTKKAKDKLMTHQIDKPVKNSGSLLHILEYKTNLSHQLFSDSKEQELINVLDLTKEEVHEKVKNTESSFLEKKKKLPYKLYNSSHPSINQSLSLIDQNQSKKKIQNWKKHLISENLSSELLQNVNVKKKILKPEKNSKPKAIENDQIQEFQKKQKSEEYDILFEGNIEENLIKNDRKSLKAQRKPKRKTSNILQKNKSSTVNDLLNKSISNDKLRSSQVLSVLSSIGSSTDNIKIADSNKPLVLEDKKAVNKKRPAFKPLNELSYKESEMGCSVAQGWSINNFKCGIFKLKVKSQMICKTVHSSSNLGGVLIKGNLRMKIGDKELNLREGDMVFVPPLTEWQATNIGECETLFYYWCGRFNV